MALLGTACLLGASAIAWLTVQWQTGFPTAPRPLRSNDPIYLNRGFYFEPPLPLQEGPARRSSTPQDFAAN
jgi:hypothetical protein